MCVSEELSFWKGGRSGCVDDEKIFLTEKGKQKERTKTKR